MRIKSLEHLTPKGGHIVFEKKIMFQWMKNRSVEYDEVDNINEYSLRFLPIEKGFCNSFVEIYGDMEHYTDCTDFEIFTLIFQQKPKVRFHYISGETVSFFEFEFGKKNIIITCDSMDDRPYWFMNTSLEEVKQVYEEPKYVTKHKN